MNYLKSYYGKNFSPSVTKIVVAGNVSKEQVLAALKPLETEWKPIELKWNTYQIPQNPEKSQIYFVDIHG